MTYFYIWLVGAILLFALWAYATGRSDPPKDEDDAAGSFFAGFFVSLLWPICLALLILIGPFVGLYELGKKHRAVDEDKKKMRDTLKK